MEERSRLRRDCRNTELRPWRMGRVGRGYILFFLSYDSFLHTLTARNLTAIL